MKLRRPEPRPRRVPTIETLRVLEREQDDLDRLFALWRNPRLHQRIKRDIRGSMDTWTESKQLYFNLAEMVKDITLLNSAFGQSAVEEEIQEEARTLVRSHEIFREPLVKSGFAKAGTPRILFWSDVVAVFPEERSRIVVPDEIFIQWLEKYSKDTKLFDSFKAVLFARMAILKPEKMRLCRDKLLALQPNLWGDRRNPSLRHIEPLAGYRILLPDLELSSEEKLKILDQLDPDSDQNDKSFFRIQLSHFAAAAILLAPKLEIDGLGNILIRPKSPDMRQTTPLPDRLQV